MAHGGVFGPPYEGVQGLLEWAEHLWPVINGKALMSHVDLKSLEASDFLDVVHYMFEEDTIPSSEVDADLRPKIRSIMYENFYNMDYKYSSASTDETVVNPSTGTSSKPKPYIPPTNPEDLSAILGEPMG